jgi:dUTP pyrophosphatase
MVLEIQKLVDRAVVPQYMTAGAAGMDLCAIDKVTIEAGRSQRVRTGLAFKIPDGYEGQVRPRSGLAAKRCITVLNAPGTLDSDYRGELVVLLINHSAWPVRIVPGDRIAQLVICPVARVEPVLVEVLDETERGAGGFGSTGRTP